MIIFFLTISDSEDPFKTFTEPMKECYRKAFSSLTRCQEEVAQQWNCAITGQQTVELSCGEGEGRTCCPMWFILRCHQKTIEDQCGQELLKQFSSTIFDPQIQQIEDKDCTQYKYSSDRCQELLDWDMNAIVVPGESPKQPPFEQQSSAQTTAEDMPTDMARVESNMPQIDASSGCGGRRGADQLIIGFVSLVILFSRISQFFNNLCIKLV